MTKRWLDIFHKSLEICCHDESLVKFQKKKKKKKQMLNKSGRTEQKRRFKVLKTDWFFDFRVEPPPQF